MSRKTIEFAAGSTAAPTPSQSGFKSSGLLFRDYTLIPEVSKLRIKFRTGKNLIRIVQGIGGSSYIQPLSVVKNQQFKSATAPGDLFQRANNWLWQNNKDAIYHFEKNKSGFKLRSQTEAIAWAIYWDEENKPHLGLIQTAYSGGKNPGLLAEIQVAADATELDPSTGKEDRVYADSIAHTENGRLITIDKEVNPDVEPQFGTSYRATISSKSGDVLQRYLEQIPEEEYNLLRPLEELIVKPDQATQTQILAGYLGGALMAKMGLTPVE